MNDNIEIKTNQLNLFTYIDIYDRLSLLSKNMFEWINLPESVDEEFIEKVLFDTGKLVFFKDDDFGYMVARCTIAGQLNFYEKPTKVRTATVGSIFTNKEIDLDKGVIIRNNVSEIPTRPTVQLFAKRISDSQRTIDINIDAQKTPLLLLCDDKQKLTLINLYKQYEGNRPVIMGNKNLSEIIDKVKAIKTDAPYVADKIMKYKHDLSNEFFTFLGINNVNTDKRERLVTNEVDANNEQIELSASIMLNSRKRACKLINKMFPDLNIDVELRNVNLENRYENNSNSYIIDNKEGEDNE